MGLEGPGRKSVRLESARVVFALEVSLGLAAEGLGRNGLVQGVEWIRSGSERSVVADGGCKGLRRRKVGPALIALASGGFANDKTGWAWS